jgi:molybdenum cofactor cytidylyltransferase
VPGVAAIVLAAGRARRFGSAADDSKVLALFEGQPLVRHVVVNALASRATPVVVVTGQAADAVVSALAGLPVGIALNPDYAQGMAGSIQAGLAAIADDATGALVLLADMPLVATSTLDRLVMMFAEEPGADALIPTYEGRPGNPVLIARSMFPALGTLREDQGARKLLAAPGYRVVFCPVDDQGIETDVDTPEALAALRGGRSIDKRG